jgi:hypothetical protein
MNVIRKMALPCGIVGGVWGLLAPLLVYAPIYMRGAEPQVGAPQQEPEEETINMAEMGMAGEVLPILSFIALMGLLGLLAIVLYQTRPRLWRIFIWVSASAMLAISLVSIFSLGLFFLPASILLILSAVGMRKNERFLIKG